MAPLGERTSNEMSNEPPDWTYQSRHDKHLTRLCKKTHSKVKLWGFVSPKSQESVKLNTHSNLLLRLVNIGIVALLLVGCYWSSQSWPRCIWDPNQGENENAKSQRQHARLNTWLDQERVVAVPFATLFPPRQGDNDITEHNQCMHYIKIVTQIISRDDVSVCCSDSRGAINQIGPSWIAYDCQNLVCIN